MRILLLAIFISGLIACKTKTGLAHIGLSNTAVQVNIDDSTVYSVVTYLFENKSSNPFLTYQKVAESAEMPFFFALKNDSLEIVKLDTIFNSKDIVYMQAQKWQFYKFKLDQNKLDNKIIIPKDSLGLAKNNPYCFISFPVFNIRRDKFIIWTGYFCGALCPESATFIYQKNGKGWKLIKVLDQSAG